MLTIGAQGGLSSLVLISYRTICITIVHRKQTCKSGQKRLNNGFSKFLERVLNSSLQGQALGGQWMTLSLTKKNMHLSLTLESWLP